MGKLITTQTHGEVPVSAINISEIKKGDLFVWVGFVLEVESCIACYEGERTGTVDMYAWQLDDSGKRKGDLVDFTGYEPTETFYLVEGRSKAQIGHQLGLLHASLANMSSRDPKALSGVARRLRGLAAELDKIAAAAR